MDNRKSNIVARIALAFCLIGSIGWFFAFLSKGFFPQRELPNSEVHGIVVDSNGIIYCGSKFYSRVQKYDPAGNFIHGFATSGAYMAGSDFGFYVNERGNLCILVSGMTKSHDASHYRLTEYDSHGNIVNSSEYTKPGTNYWYPTKNSTRDSTGNVYIFKGFLFPRVIKIASDGSSSAIIRTPLWLWSFQAPFPAFAFFFVSVITLVLLQFKAEANEIGIRTLNYILRTDKLPSRNKVLRFAFTIMAIIAALLVLIPLSIKYYPELFLFAFLSLWVSGVIFWFMSIIIMGIYAWRGIKLKINLFDKLAKGASLKEKYEKSIGDANRLCEDSVVKKTSRISGRILKAWLLTWLGLVIIATCVVLYLDHIGVWKPILKR